MKNLFHWVEIRTRDLEKAKKFYQSLFDWEITGEKDEKYWLIDLGGGTTWGDVAISRKQASWCSGIYSS